VPLLNDFWGPFKEQVVDKDANVSRKEVAQARELGIDPASGQPVSVRIGRFGPYVQIGSAEGDTKPRFVSLRQGLRMDTVTLEEALALAVLPREVGEDAEGNTIVANIGRFGPYLKIGSKYVSIKPPDDPYTVELPRALEIIREKEIADAAKFIKEFAAEGIRILNGRYGPYVTDGKRNARVPKDREPASIDLKEAQALLEAAPATRRRFPAKGAKAKATA
jgi:DNA topoisomerase-1